MHAVVGLGNPGSEYAETRHNVGFMVMDELLRRAGARARRGDGDYDAARVQLAGQPVLLVKPRTYVNRSGRAVQQLGATHGILPEELLVVVDDIYLPFGRLRLRPSGSAGGHNGLRSIVEVIGPGFARLRLGVGAPAGSTPLPDHVLAPFEPDERAALPAFISRAADAVQLILERGVLAAMPEVNRPPEPP